MPLSAPNPATSRPSVGHDQRNASVAGGAVERDGSAGGRVTGADERGVAAERGGVDRVDVGCDAVSAGGRCVTTGAGGGAT